MINELQNDLSILWWRSLTLTSLLWEIAITIEIIIIIIINDDTCYIFNLILFPFLR